LALEFPRSAKERKSFYISDQAKGILYVKKETIPRIVTIGISFGQSFSKSIEIAGTFLMNGI